MNRQVHFHPIDELSLQDAIVSNVSHALNEDLGHAPGNGRVEHMGHRDISASLMAPKTQATARVITREPGIFCGAPWVTECLSQIDETAEIHWHVNDSDAVEPDQILFELNGSARSLLSAERTMLNFAQLLSGTATRTAGYVALIKHTKARLLDTRKTVPGLRMAQKYAVKSGGGSNHRIGLFDAFLLKENHVMAAGGIREAIEAAQQAQPGVPVEIEVENLDELQQALEFGADIALIDNFSIADTQSAVTLCRGKLALEASGNINHQSIVAVAETGVDFISCGDLTKEVVPLDLSMRFVLT